MLSARDLTLRRGPQPLFEQVNFTVFRGNKVGITGANGAGKSSLFAAIRGELTPDRGAIDAPAALKRSCSADLRTPRAVSYWRNGQCVAYSSPRLSATRLAACPLASTTTTEAPSAKKARTVASPIPLPPPHTTAVRPANLFMSDIPIMS